MNAAAGSPEVIMITGASSGIGRALAFLFARDGAQLVLVARRRDRLEQLASQLVEGGAVSPKIVAVDLAEADAVKQVVDAATALHGRIDVLINNAGLGDFGPFAEQTFDQIQRMIDLNIVALVDLTACVLPGMRERRCGRIVNVASGAAFVPIPNFAVYAATKAFVLSFSEALRGECRKSGVTVTCVCPGITKTEFFTRPGARRDFDPSATFGVSVEGVARDIHRAIRAGRMTRIVGLGHRLSVWSARLFPRWIVLAFMRRVTQIAQRSSSK